MVPQGIAYTTCHVRSNLGSNSWIIDSGATSHIASSIDVFSSYTPIQNSFVTLLDHTIVEVHSIGIVQVLNTFQYSHVLCIPKFRVNLLFVPALLRNTY